MPISLDDQARLPPMIPYEEVCERQRLADLKAFRQYLVETGAAKCLVKLYQHTAKHEMRMDNPRILKEFLSEYIERTPDTEECDRLTEENAMLRERNEQLQLQADQLARDLERARRLRVGQALWDQLTLAEFWDGAGDSDACAAGLRITQIYPRLCGQKEDSLTGLVLVNLLRPNLLKNEQELSSFSPMQAEAFCEWIANGIPEGLHVWCRDEFVPRLTSWPDRCEPPYERELLQAIRDTGLYPDHIDDIPTLVGLGEGLVSFLNAVKERFQSGS